jgi:RHS repeat-associated protein
MTPKHIERTRRLRLHVWPWFAVWLCLFTLALPLYADDGDTQFTQVVTLARATAGTPGLARPVGVTIDPESGNAFVASQKDHQIQLVSQNGTLSVLAGSSKPGYKNGTGKSAQFHEPVAVTFHAASKALFVADRQNHVIRRVTLNGTVTTFAGSGRPGLADGQGTKASFKHPAGIAVDERGYVYVADTGNSTIRKIAPDGTVTTIAGGSREGYADGGSDRALFKQPHGIAVGQFGDAALYIADTGNHCIRRLLNGSVTTIAGTTHGGYVDGSGVVAEFNNPTAIVALSATELFVADRSNNVIRRLNVFGGNVAEVTTLAGAPLQSGFVDGAPRSALFDEPAGIAAAGALWVADWKNDAVRIIHPEVTLAALRVTSGPPSGGTTVDVFGSGFLPGTTKAWFGALPTLQTSWISAYQLKVITPPHAPGVVDVMVRTTTDEAVQPAAFEYRLPFVSMELSAERVTLKPGDRTTLRATAIASDGARTDVTSAASWNTSNAAVATVTGGVINAQADGEATVSATLAPLSGSVAVSVVSEPAEPLPPDPSTVAPQPNRTVVAALGDELRFLYSGPNRIQQDVTPNAIDEERMVHLRGRILRKNGTPLGGARVSVLHHTELGHTVSRADGYYDLIVNGGGSLTLVFQRKGSPEIQRLVTTKWGDQKVLEDVVLTEYDTRATPVAMGAAVVQIARANVASDADGSRRATLIFPAGTAATLVLADGTERPAATLTIRATEYTVGASGMAAMPAPLPPTSGYTYCVELSADEAIDADAREVKFARPVTFYLENFLGFDVGDAVPSGYYDRTRGYWSATDNGRVIRIVAVSNGLAALDVDGDGEADASPALTAMGIDDAERAAVASLYQPGQTLWRVPVPHFSPVDYNWPAGPPAGAVTPGLPTPQYGAYTEQPCRIPGNSVVDCHNQRLAEEIPISGTPFTLHYDSGRAAPVHNEVDITVSDPELPEVLRKIELSVSIAGKSFNWQFAPEPNLKQKFTWDGRDAFGREVQGIREATITVGYVYELQYFRPTDYVQPAFARATGIRGSQRRELGEITYEQSWTVPMGQFSTQAMGFGGWTLSAHRIYDGRGKVFYDGANTRAADPKRDSRAAVHTVAGNGACCDTGEGGPATEAQLYFPSMIAAASDGRFFISESWKIKEVGRDGRIRTVVGTGRYGSSPDGTPAHLASINAWDVAVGPDDTLYINDQGNYRIKRVVNGVLTTVAGNGTRSTYPAPFINGQPATSISIDPEDITVGPDGTLYIAEAQRIVAVAPDGVARQIAGAPGVTDRTYGDGGPATAAGVRPSSIAVALDGTVYVSDGTEAVRRILPSGIIELFAGAYARNSDLPYVRDGERATAGRLRSPWGLAVASDGTVLIGSVSEDDPRIRAVGSDGIIRTLGGTGESASRVTNGGLARSTPLSLPWDITLGGDGSLMFIDYYLNVARATKPLFPNATAATVLLPSDDGAQGFLFQQGRHTRTVDTLTGAVLYEFSYNNDGFLTSVADVDGNVTAIEYGSGGKATAIVAPGGQRTALTIGTTGLVRIANPAGEAHEFSYAAGLMTSRRDPRGYLYQYAWDTSGRLLKDSDPAGGFISLTRSAATALGFTVEQTSALARTRRYEVLRLSDSSEERTVFGADNLPSYETIVDGNAYTFTPTGSRIDAYTSPDPRFGALAPLNSRTVIGLPSGIASTVEYEQAVELADPRNPLTVKVLTESLKRGGREYRTRYDASTRKVTFTSPAGRTSAIALDPQGRVAAVEIPGMASTFYDRDAAGRVSAIRTGSRSLTLSYTPRHELTKIVDPLGREINITYDDAGRPKSQTLYGGRVLSFEYDPNGNLTSVTPPGRGAHLYTYSPVNLRESYTAPEGAAIRYTFDKDRNPTAVQRRDGGTTGFVYDVAGRISEVGTRDERHTFAYSSRGTVESAVSADATIAYTFDGPFVTQTAWSGSVSGSVEHQLDEFFDVVSENGTAYQYDADGLPIQAGAITITRDTRNGLIKASVLGPIADAYGYNEFAEMTSYTVHAGTEPLMAITYERDSVGRIARAGTRAYEYDAAGRLHRVKDANTVIAEYEYDTSGNRKVRRAHDGEETATYDAHNRLLTYGDTAYTYSANGELASATTSGAVTAYKHDSFGNLRTVRLPGGITLEYLIDAQNRRIGKKINGELTNGWLYADQLRVVAELDGTGAIRKRFVYGTRPHTPDYMVTDGGTYRIVTDHRGSPVVVLSVADGTVLQELAYDEFGRVLRDTNPGFQPFGFAGGLFDRDTGFVHFGARDYDARTGRWTSEDPYEFYGGENFYVYGHNDPVNFVDSSGDVPIAVAIIGVAAVVGGVSEAWAADGGVSDKAIAFAQGAVSGAVGASVGIAAAIATKNPLIVGSSAGLASEVTKQFMKYGGSCWDASAMGWATAVGGAMGGVVAAAPAAAGQGLGTIGRLPNIWKNRPFSNYGPNAQRLLKAEFFAGSVGNGLTYGIAEATPKCSCR